MGRQLLLPLLLLLGRCHSDSLLEDILSCKTWDQDPDELAKTGQNCVFPFIFEDVEYNGCTKYKDPKDEAWCATAVDRNSEMRKDQFGHCNPGCPDHRNEPVKSASIPGALVDLHGRCAIGFQCIPHEKCPSFRAELAKLDRKSPNFEEKLLDLKTMVCNYPNSGVCCSAGNSKVKVKADKGCDSGLKGLSNPSYLPERRLDESQDDDEEEEECGYTADTSRIVGGEKTKPGTYPSAALLGYRTQERKKSPFQLGIFDLVDKLKYFCGGTLINRWYVITAAHCKEDREKFVVALGEWDTGNDPKSPDCDPREVTACQPPVQIMDFEENAWIIHKDFAVLGENRVNDIALVKLPQMATITDSVIPICLPLDPAGVASFIGVTDLRQGMEGKRPEVVGWGFMVGDRWLRTTNGSSGSRYQQVLDVPVRGTDQCSTVSNLQESQICAGGEDGHDACKGDSGGPLYISKFAPDTNKIVPIDYKYLYGIVSIGPSNCGTHPTIYTRVESFIPWIKEKIGAC